MEIWPNPYSGGEDLRPIIDQYAPLLGSVNERNTTVQNRDLSNFAVIDRMYFFNDRLIGSGGVRWDKDDAVTRQVHFPAIGHWQMDAPCAAVGTFTDGKILISWQVLRW